ncbi:MAG: double-strand break repair protein AddB [Xanthobacteraceae bacterium]
MAVRTPRLFTIPASAPFLPTLVKALLAGRLVPGFPASRDPLALAGATLYLPTRRACGLAREVFLEEMETSAAVLPRILPIGDIDEDELVFAEAATGPLAGMALELPPALGRLERRLLLARLVLQWAAAPKLHGEAGAPLVAHSPAAALALADDLARLIDDMTTRKVPWRALDDLVPERFDRYWQLTLDFLKIARDTWPAILAERNAIEPAERRDRLIEAEAARLASVDGPVIAAGSTASMPATATLLATIALLPHGAVVLPGLDQNIHAPAWDLIAGKRQEGSDAIAPAIGHPQFAMQALLKRLGVGRGDVASLSAPAPHGREKLVSEALCPAAASECWQRRLPAEAIGMALASVAVIEAGNAEEEALAIAVALREAVETPGKRAALVTADRALARRVIAALARWSVPVNDSGGDALPDMPAGVFARLAAEAALGGLAPVTLLALLKHPLLRLGAREGAHNFAIDVLERAILRGPRPRPGTAGLAHALATLRRERPSLHASDPRKRIKDSELDAADRLVTHLTTALYPLEGLEAQKLPLSELAGRHRNVVAALASHASRIAAFAGDDGTALATAFDELVAASDSDLAVAPADYAELFRAVIGDRLVRRSGMADVRVHIFGLLEARLQSVDLMALGGVVEGTWPPETRSDAWLSRPMRQDLGLDLPERRIGLTAHDFAQALGAPEVILSRAAKIAGAPTLWSRFVQRLAAVAGETEWHAAQHRGARYLALAHELDRPRRPQRIQPPAPKPPLAARPTGLSVTDVEHWLRDPYTIYAKHVLRLAPLDAVDTPPGYADRGTVIHASIGEFTTTYREGLPADAVGELIRIGRKHFAPLDDYPEACAFWWPRFRRIARWFAGWETERRAAAAAMHAEIAGEFPIPLDQASFRLRARADRIEQMADGRYAILDYKTGQARTEKQVRTGLAPQLTLEAAILRHGGFAGIAKGASVAELSYVLLKGGEPAGEPCPVEFKEGDCDSQADRALSRLTGVARRFADENTPYRSLVHPMWRTHYGDYDHLARVKEWSLTGGELDEAASDPAYLRSVHSLKGRA